MKKCYYCSNAASIVAAIKGLNATYNVATFYDSYSYIELLSNNKIEIHLDINNIVNANGESLVIIDKRDNSYVATFNNYVEAIELLLEESDYCLIDDTCQYDVYL